MSLIEAKKAEAESRFVLAYTLYEAAHQASPLEPEDLVNFICLCWQVEDFGFTSYHQLSDDFIRVVDERLFKLLEQGSALYPSRPEFPFWNGFIRCMSFGDQFTTDSCRKLLQAHPWYLEAALYPFMAEQTCVNEAKLLLAQCRGVNTYRARYIVSVLGMSALLK